MIVRLYTGDDGQSHFEDLPYPDGDDVITVAPKPGVDMTVRRAPDGQFYDWHTASPRHYAFIVSGEMEAVIGDGTVRRFGPGTMILEEDTTGQGHTTRVVTGPCIVVNITLPE